MLRMLKATLVLFIIIGACLSCGEDTEEFILEELFNPNNPETHGDPYNLRVKIEAEGGVLLRFSYIPEIDGIIVYRSTEENSEFKKIGIVTVTKYVDEQVQSDITYYYKLRAYRGIEEFSASATVSLYITPNSNTPMVLIPAGEFQMGSDDWWRDSPWNGSDVTPAHIVYLDAFYMDKYEVTNAQFKCFVEKAGYVLSREEGNSLYELWTDDNINGDDQPVMGVTWEDAVAYCKWARKRLPTEAEWEKAALGGEKVAYFAENFADEAFNEAFGGFLSHVKNYNDGYVYAAPVGSFSPNGYGIYDMSGNVQEWCSDWYSEHYYEYSPTDNPKGPGSGNSHVYRGASWFSYTDLPIVERHHGTTTYSTLGFRCVKDVVP